MKVRFVDGEDPFGSGKRWQTCIRPSADVQVLLADWGAASWTALRSQGPDPGASTAVAVTHLHGGHFRGVSFLPVDGQFSHRTVSLLAARLPGTTGRLAQAMKPRSPAPVGAPRRFAARVRRMADPRVIAANQHGRRRRRAGARAYAKVSMLCRSVIVHRHKCGARLRCAARVL